MKLQSFNLHNSRIYFIKFKITLMKNYLIFVVFIFISGCASVPKQVVDAMAYQKLEIESVKKLYFENMNNQLNSIEKYQLDILDIYKQQNKDQIRKSPGTEIDENGNKSEVLTDPTGDPEIDVYNVKLLNQIEKFYEAEKDSVRVDIDKRREKILIAQKNFENIELINSTVNDYLKSLVRLKESRDKLAKSIRSKLINIVPIPLSFDEIIEPSTIENKIKNFK